MPSSSRNGSSRNDSSRNGRRARVLINTDALTHNLNKVREYAPGCRVMPVIKADAYGHGMLMAASHLRDADMFAVAMPQEALLLCQHQTEKPILVLQGFSSAEELKQLSNNTISTVIHQRHQLELLLNSSLQQPLDVWLKIDTGMHRLGILPGDAEEFITELQNCDNVRSLGLMSHFANAEEVSHPLNTTQISSFTGVTRGLNLPCSMANSAAIMRIPDSHFNLVRPGIMLYGSSPFADTTAQQLGLMSVMQFESILIDIKKLSAGDSVGYGSMFTADSDMRVGIVAAGYADGYPRHAETGTPVWLNRHCRGLLGRVSMDSICIDLGDVGASIGDRVVLWGDELSVDQVAASSNTIAYELLCNAGAANLRSVMVSTP